VGVKGGRRVGLTASQPYVNRLSRENVGASTSHYPMGLHGLLQGYPYLLPLHKDYGLEPDAVLMISLPAILASESESGDISQE
jgi:hypothetical protein